MHFLAFRQGLGRPAEEGRRSSILDPSTVVAHVALMVCKLVRRASHYKLKAPNSIRGLGPENSLALGSDTMMAWISHPNVPAPFGLDRLRRRKTDTHCLVMAVCKLALYPGMLR